ncbi:MAG: GMC family oxidoreductase [Myxococcaceae bacterium]|nr:GMC family oxidoreductase [Myxococcaceae bacterium]
MEDTLYDAIVIGSGATGGVAAKQLTEAGLKVVVLEAGRMFKGGSEYGTQAGNMAKAVWRHFVTKNQRTQELHGGYWEVNPDLFTDDLKNPYTTAPGRPYRWIRGRQVGGRSLTWGGVTLRFSDYEFKAASHDGYGEDWPIGLADLEPYYAMLERFFHTHGSRENIPTLPDGEFEDPSPLTPGERVFKEKVEARWPERRVIPARGIKAGRNPARGDRYSRLSSPGTTLAAANATGNLTLRADAVVSKIVVDEQTGRASGVEFIDANTRALHLVRGKLVFCCASTIETIRILWRSTSVAHPDGLGASSGVLGRYVMDHIVSTIYFYMPEVPDDRRERFELLGSDSIIVPRWMNLEGRPTEPYLRGFGLWGGIQRLPFPSLLLKKKGMAFGFLCAMGEALPHADNRVTLDSEKKDAWGLPVPHIACSWVENDLLLAGAAQAETEAMIKEAGGVICSLTDLVRTPLVGEVMKGMQREWMPTTPGLFVHEVGGARMGSSPKSSVTNPNCQLWDAPNVFVTDGACWVSSGWQNPTLTEMAITARACAIAVDALRRDNL